MDISDGAAGLAALRRASRGRVVAGARAEQAISVLYRRYMFRVRYCCTCGIGMVRAILNFTTLMLKPRAHAQMTLTN